MRVDHVENEYLRTQYSGKVVQNVASSDYNNKLNALGAAAAELRNYVATNSGKMQQLNCTEMGELDNYLGKLNGARDAFQLMVKPLETRDSTLSRVADDLYFSAKQFTDVYRESCAKGKLDQQDIKKLKEELEGAEKKAKGYADKLRQMGVEVY